MRTWIVAAALVVCAALLVSPAFADESRADVQDRVKAAADVFNEIMNVPENSIPQNLLERADCIMIVPSMIKGGFVVGGRYGKGVATCREAGHWSAPAMMKVAGGSVGFQIGAEAVDLVMLVMNKRGEQFLYKDKVTIGADISGAAGPVGRMAAADTNATLKSEILTYSRAKGLFAGAVLNGATIRPDKDADRALYGNEVSTREILAGGVRTPAEAQPLIAAISRHWRTVSENEPSSAPANTADRDTDDTLRNDARRAGHTAGEAAEDVGHGAVEGGKAIGRGVGHAASDVKNGIHRSDRDNDNDRAAADTGKHGKHYRVEAGRLTAAADVFSDMYSSAAPDKSIPRDLLDRAQCVVVIPSLKKAAFGIGGKYGKGPASCRTANGWSAPAIVELEGGSIGWQFGGESVDLVMLVMNKRGEDFLYKDRINLGADVSAAAGPVGRSASAETNATLKSEILTYSRAKGAFAGISLNGASLRPDGSANRALYGKDVTAREILAGNVTPPPAAQSFLAALEGRTRPAGVNAHR